MGKSRLIFFDTTNYTDFPIGGQLTSVRSLLRFLCETCPERCGEIVLCGVSKKQEEAGRLQELSLFGQNITFLPVTAAETDLAHTAKSLRAAFAAPYHERGLLLSADAGGIRTGQTALCGRFHCHFLAWKLCQHGTGLPLFSG